MHNIIKCVDVSFVVLLLETMTKAEKCEYLIRILSIQRILPLSISSTEDLYHIPYKLAILSAAKVEHNLN